MTDNINDFIDEISSDPELMENLKDLVTARIQSMPSNVELAIGSKQLSKEELFTHLQQGDEFGKEIMETELEFIRDLASGAIYQYE